MSKQRDDVVFLKVDVDEAEDVAMAHNVSAMPTFVFIRNKKKVHRFFKVKKNSQKTYIIYALKFFFFNSQGH